MFELTAQPIDGAALSARLRAPEAGALTIFEGRVRNHHLGQPVTQLEYEAFDEMAIREGEAIVGEAASMYPGAQLLCVHRTGTLQVGDVAVWIGVASAHRQAGFAACRHLIEELKLRLPIWKKEHHPDGAAEWVNCSVEATARPAGDDLHSRQSALPEVGAAGQEKLAKARVLLVGVGGLGCPAALYLVGAGIGRLTLVDGGKVERSNLHRQILYTTAETGSPKVLAAAARLRLHNPAVQISIHDGELTAGNARTLVAGHDVVLDGTDNFASRFLIHDACLALGVPLVQAAVHRFEGTLDVFQRGEGGCLHCLWLGRDRAALDTAGNCAGGPVFGPAVGVLGVMQAAEAIKQLLGLGGDAARQTRLVNLLDGSQLNVGRSARPDCPVCARVDRLREMPAPAITDRGLFVDAAGVRALGASAKVIYLTEPGEQPPAGLPGIAAADLAALRELALQGPLVLACRYGVRSAALARMLRAEGMEAIFAESPKS